MEYQQFSSQTQAQVDAYHQNIKIPTYYFTFNTKDYGLRIV
jgi:hypothetical protein